MRLTVRFLESNFFVVPIGTNFRAEALGSAVDVKESSFSSVLTVVEVCVTEIRVVTDFIMVPATYTREGECHLDLLWPYRVESSMKVRSE